MHGCCLFSGHWFGRGHSVALVGKESRCSCLARPKPGRLLKKPRSAGEAGYQLYVMPSVLSICQGGKRCYPGACVKKTRVKWHVKQHIWCICVCIFLDGDTCVCITYFFYGPGVFYWPIHPLCTYCSLWVHMVLTHSHVVLSVSPAGHTYIHLWSPHCPVSLLCA